ALDVRVAQIVALQANTFSTVGGAGGSGRGTNKVHASGKGEDNDVFSVQHLSSISALRYDLVLEYNSATGSYTGNIRAGILVSNGDLCQRRCGESAGSSSSRGDRRNK